MKKMIKYITENIRPPLLAFLYICIVGNVIGQAEKPISAPAYIQNTCGFYPSNGTWVQATSVTYGGNGCTTTITPSSTTVYFTARGKVILLPGFTAQKGSNFVAYVEPYSSARDVTMPVALNADTSNEAALANQKVNENVTVAPNPFTGFFTVTINAKKDSKAQVSMYNSVGEKVKDQQGVNFVKGINKLSFNGSSFTSGVYMLEVNFGDSKIVKKIVKAN